MTYFTILFLLLLAMHEAPSLVLSVTSLGYNHSDESPNAFASTGFPSTLTPVLPSLGPRSYRLRIAGKKHILCNEQNSNACKAFSERHVCCFNLFCLDLSCNPFHCGFCGHKCKHGMRCCRGVCVDCRSNRNHCGRCWNSCAADEICSFGMCGYA